MAPLSLAELERIASGLQDLVGAQIQDCVQTPSELGLAFYHEREMLWLWFDLHPRRPLVIRIHGKPPHRKKITRPLLLFLRSRFLGRRLESVRADLVQGRVLILAFHRAADELSERDGSDPLEKNPPVIEARLFPHGQNIIARDGVKVVAERKPKESPSPTGAGVGAGTGMGAGAGAEDETGRTWEVIEDQWRAEQRAATAFKGVKAAAQDAAVIEREWQKAIEKKGKALDRMHEELKEKLETADVDARIGEWLKSQGHVGGFDHGSESWSGNWSSRWPSDWPNDWPEKWKERIDSSQSLSWNIQECFHRAKESARKTAGTRARLEQVERELAELRARGPAAFAESLDKGRGRSAATPHGRAISGGADAENLLARAEARGRRLRIGEDLEVYIGKSAADNLALLRRAQPFDYWLHLRDQPGSHAIMRRSRGRVVTDVEFVQAGRWVVEQSLGKRATELKGERHDLLIVECRFVRPIKGDRLGRVNYTHDRVLRLVF